MRWSRLLAPVGAAAVMAGVFAPPAGASTGVDLYISVAANDTAVAVGGSTSFNVQVVNQGTGTSSPVTITFAATHGQITAFDTSVDPRLSCSVGSPSTCTISPGLNGNFDGFGFDVTLSVDASPSVSLSATASSSPDTDLNSADNTSSDSVNAQDPPAASLAHQQVWFLDYGQPASRLNMTLTRDSDSSPIFNEQLSVSCRPTGSSGSYVPLDGYPYGNSWTDADGVLAFQLDNLNPVDYDCIADHPATVYASAIHETFTISPRASQLAASYSALSLTYGTKIKVSASLKDSSGHAIPDANDAHLQRRAAGSSDPWADVATIPLDYTTGTGSLSISLTGTADYRVHYGGNYFGGDSDSAPAQITVRQGVAVVLNPIIVPPGGTSVLTATVRPNETGQPVQLQRKTSTGWALVSTKNLLTGSKQSWKFKPAKTGVTTYRVHRAGSGTGVGTLAPGSAAATLTVTLKGKGDSRAFYFMQRYNGHPASWNPCQVIHFRVNPHNATKNGIADVKEALRRIHIVNGLRFHYDGTTSIVPSPWTRYKTPLIVAWTKDTSKISQNYDGIGGMSYAAVRNGHMVIRNGFVLLNANYNSGQVPGFGRGYTEGELLMHELGHAVGLDHPGMSGHDDSYEIMHPQMRSLKSAVWGAGDLAGLKKLGTSQGCF